MCSRGRIKIQKEILDKMYLKVGNVVSTSAKGTLMIVRKIT